MFLIPDDAMYPIGYGTVVLYLLSMTFFLFALFYKDFFIIGIALSTIFFIISSVIIGIMVKQRMNT